MKHRISILLLSAIALVSCGENKTGNAKPFTERLTANIQYKLDQSRKESPKLTLEIDMESLVGNNEEASKMISYEITKEVFGAEGIEMNEALRLYSDSLRQEYLKRKDEYIGYVDNKTIEYKKLDRYEAEYIIRGVASGTANNWLNYSLTKDLNTEKHFVTLNFDPDTGKRITLDDIFKGEYKEKLQELLYENYFKNCGSPYKNASEVPISEYFIPRNNTIDFRYDTPDNNHIDIKIRYSAMKEYLQFYYKHDALEEEKFRYDNRYCDDFDADADVFVTRNNDVIFKKDCIMISEEHKIDPTDRFSPTMEIKIRFEYPKANNKTAAQKICNHIIERELGYKNMTPREACEKKRDCIVSMLDFDTYYTQTILEGDNFLIMRYNNAREEFCGSNAPANGSILRYTTNSYSLDNRAWFTGSVAYNDIHTYNYDAYTGNLIELKDLFKENYETGLRAIAEKVIIDKMEFRKDIYPERLTHDILSEYLIEEDCLVLIMQYYYMGFYSEEVRIPYERIRHLMK